MTVRSMCNEPRGLEVGREDVLSDAFFEKLIAMGERHNTDPLVWLDVWNAESGLNPAAENVATHAQGLNQMMPLTLKGLNFPAGRAFKDLAGEEQLPWIERLITMGEKLNGGPFLSAARYYHFNFFPRTMGRGSSPETVVVSYDSADGLEVAAYLANKGLDHGAKGKVTVADLTATLEGAKQARREKYTMAVMRLRRPPRAAPKRGSGSAPVLIGLALLAAGVFAWRSSR